MKSPPEYPLAKLADFISGGTPSKQKPEFYEGSIPWITGADLDSDGTCAARSYITASAIRESAAPLVEKNAVLLVTRTAVGKVTLATENLSFSQDITGIRPDTSLIDASYLKYFLGAHKKYFETHARGSTIKGITRDVLRRLRVPLLTLSQQRKVVRLMDAAVDLREVRRGINAHSSELSQAIFIDRFGDPVSNSRGLPKEPLGTLGVLERGISKHRPRNDPVLLGGPYPLIQTGDVANCDGYLTEFSSTYSEVGLQQSKLWPAGTLCITIAANIAHAGVLTFDACFPDSVVGFTSDPATTMYVKVWLSFLQRGLEETASQSAQKNINLGILRNLLVPVPPLDERIRFAAQLSKVRDLKRSYREQLRLADELFISLQSRAFKGEL